METISLGMVNKYMDLWLEDPENLAYKARAEKYAKITAKTIISSGADSSSYGQNAFFCYDAAGRTLTSVLLLIAEYCPKEQRHIVSVFKLIQDLLAPLAGSGKEPVPAVDAEIASRSIKQKWFAGAALNTADQAMARPCFHAWAIRSIELNAFLDSEMEQILCFDGSMDTGDPL